MCTRILYFTLEPERESRRYAELLLLAVNLFVEISRVSPPVFRIMQARGNGTCTHATVLENHEGRL